MNSSLTLKYEFSRDGDDFGWLTARVETRDFSGRNGMWVQWQDVTEFAQALAAYPIAADEPIVREWGFGGDGDHEVVTSVSIAPQGRTGGLIVDVYLANYYDLFHRCQTCFQSDYPTLDRFRRDLASMMRREAQTAVLSGSEASLR